MTELTFRYSAFGLTLQVPFPCPELLTSNENRPPEVIVGWGTVPASLSNPTLEGPFFQRDAHHLLLHVPQVAAYYVENGTHITIEADERTSVEQIRLFLFDTVLATLLQQRGICPLPGFSFVAHGEAILVVKGRGTLGASSLAAALRERGFPLLSDGYSAVCLDTDGKACALPGLSCQYLWEDVIEMMKLDTASMTQLYPDLGKYRVDFTDIVERKPLPITRIYVMGYGREILIQPVEGVRQVNILWPLVYQALLSEFNPMPIVLTLAQQAAIYDLCYGSEKWYYREVAAALEAQIHA